MFVTPLVDNVSVELYEDDAASDPILLDASDLYELKPSDIGNWVTIPLSSTLSAGVSYLAAVRGEASPFDTVGISISSNDNAVSYIQDNGCNICANPPCTFGYWYSISDPLLIRLNLCEFPLPSSINDNIFDEKFSVHPNPSKGIFNIDLIDEKNGDYLIIKLKKNYLIMGFKIQLKFSFRTGTRRKW